MTYQEAVSEHMATAPEELKRYVCGRLIDDSWWEESGNPILYSAVTWGKSKEGGNFWYYVSTKEWSNVMATLFWQNRNNEEKKTMTDYQNKIREQYARLLDKQLAKNKDYGNSVFNDIEVFGETISAETSCKARIADKLKRLSSASFQVDESHDDTIDDLIGYLVAYRIIRNNKRHTKIEL